jgi:hypothetical protein
MIEIDKKTFPANFNVKKSAITNRFRIILLDSYRNGDYDLYHKKNLTEYHNPRWSH